MVSVLDGPILVWLAYSDHYFIDYTDQQFEPS
jgi:hypothetical protein